MKFILICLLSTIFSTAVRAEAPDEILNQGELDQIYAYGVYFNTVLRAERCTVEKATYPIPHLYRKDACAAASNVDQCTFDQVLLSALNQFAKPNGFDSAALTIGLEETNATDENSPFDLSQSHIPIFYPITGEVLMNEVATIKDGTFQSATQNYAGTAWKTSGIYSNLVIQGNLFKAKSPTPVVFQNFYRRNNSTILVGTIGTNLNVMTIYNDAYTFTCPNGKNPLITLAGVRSSFRYIIQELKGK